MAPNEELNCTAEESSEGIQGNGSIQPDRHVGFNGVLGGGVEPQREFVESLISQRRDFLKESAFVKAAVIQENLVRLGIRVVDTKEGVRWYAS